MQCLGAGELGTLFRGAHSPQREPSRKHLGALSDPRAVPTQRNQGETHLNSSEVRQSRGDPRGFSVCVMFCFLKALVVLVTNTWPCKVAWTKRAHMWLWVRVGQAVTLRRFWRGQCQNVSTAHHSLGTPSGKTKTVCRAYCLSVFMGNSLSNKPFPSSSSSSSVSSFSCSFFVSL